MAKVDPLHIFVHAEQFRWAAKYLPSARQDNMPFQVDMAIPVCSAFALELYLKCLIAIKGRPVPPKHDLKDLFERLEPDLKARVRANSETYLEDVKIFIAEKHQAANKPVPIVDFNYVLRVSRKAFELARYFYESGLSADQGWIADGIMEGARKTILEMYPHWERARLNEPRVETRIPPT